jgi:hypothetical protein
MSEYHWNILKTYEDKIQASNELSVFSDVRKVAADRSILLPQKFHDYFGTGRDILEILCFVDRDDILPYPYTITCIAPKHTSLLKHLVDTDPAHRFLGTIDKKSRLRLPIDTLEIIRITKEAFISTFDGFSWSVMDPEQEILSHKIFAEKLNSWEISVPEELLNADRNK